MKLRCSQISCLLWGNEARISLGAKNRKLFSSKTKDQVCNKEQLSLSRGPGEKQDPKGLVWQGTVGVGESGRHPACSGQGKANISSQSHNSRPLVILGPAILFPGIYIYITVLGTQVHQKTCTKMFMAGSGCSRGTQPAYHGQGSGFDSQNHFLKVHRTLSVTAKT